MRAVVSASFDPITQKELEWIVSCRRMKGCQTLYVHMPEEGILSYSLRRKLLKRALAPYRHIHVTEKVSPEDTVMYLPDGSGDGEAVRSGIVRLAARSTRNMLWHETEFLELCVQSRCTEQRASHSVSVAKTAEYFAARYGLDRERMRIAGYLHDITKKQSNEENLRVMNFWYPEFAAENYKVWHSFTAEVFLRQEMCCYDRIIRSAVRHHTLGDGMSDHDRILYIADKIEPTRPYPIDTEWKIAERSLKEAAEFIFEETRQFIDTEEKNV